MTNKQILKHIQALAREECANYRAGCCALTNQRCHIITPFHAPVQDSTISCDYFLENMLPAAWDMQDLVAYALWYGADDSDASANSYPDSLRRCAICQQPYLHSGNEPECCDECADILNRQRRWRSHEPP